MALFTSLEGRIGRKPFWLAIIALAALGAPLAVAGQMGLNNSWTFAIASILISIALTFASIAVNSKRLHDLGKSSWYQALPISLYGLALLMNIVGLAIFGPTALPNPEGLPQWYLFPLGAIFLMSMLANILLVVWLGFFRGQLEDNEFGSAPRMVYENPFSSEQQVGTVY